MLVAPCKLVCPFPGKPFLDHEVILQLPHGAVNVPFCHKGVYRFLSVQVPVIDERLDNLVSILARIVQSGNALLQASYVLAYYCAVDSFFQS